MTKLNAILRFIVQQHIKVLYYLTENTYASILLGYVSYHGMHSTDFNTFRFSCFLFTAYFVTVSFIVYIVSRSLTCSPFFVKIIGLDFHSKYIGLGSREQLISAIIICFLPLTIELLTDFVSKQLMYRIIALETETWESHYGKDHSKWDSNIRTKCITRCNRIRDAHVPGGYITRIAKALRDFYYGRKN